MVAKRKHAQGTPQRPRLPRWAVVLLAASWLSLTAGGDEAAAAPAGSASFNVTVGVEQRCVVSVTDINFGYYLSGGTHATNPLDASGTMSVWCDRNGRNVRVRLDQGLYPFAGSTANDPLRQMDDGSGNRIDYNVFEDAARTIVWSERNPGVLMDKPYPTTRDVYGRIPAGQAPPPGTYRDTITVTYTF